MYREVYADEDKLSEIRHEPMPMIRFLVQGQLWIGLSAIISRGAWKGTDCIKIH